MRFFEHATHTAKATFAQRLLEIRWSQGPRITQILPPVQNSQLCHNDGNRYSYAAVIRGIISSRFVDICTLTRLPSLRSGLSEAHVCRRRMADLTNIYIYLI